MARWYRISDTEWIQAEDVTLNQYGEISAGIGAGAAPSSVQIAAPGSDESPAQFGITPRVSAEAEVNQEILHGMGMAATPEVQALNLNQLGKIGCWIQSRSIGNPLAWNSSIDFFIATTDLIDDVELLAGGRPILIASTSLTSAPLIKKMRELSSRIVGVMWDYECLLPEHVITEVHDAANELGLLLIISTKFNAADALALAYAGFTYADARKFCELAAPQFYAQQLSNNGPKLKLQYDGVIAASTAPVIPIITTEVINPLLLKYNVLDAAKIQAIYGPMNMTRVICWNVTNTDASQWAAIESVLV